MCAPEIAEKESGVREAFVAVKVNSAIAMANVRITALITAEMGTDGDGTIIALGRDGSGRNAHFE
jgi:hypothetical protein